MKKLLTIFPWAALLALGVISVPRLARTTPPPEGHPHIRAAVQELREARRELESAAHDFCGHRKDALHDVDKSLEQLEKALECNK